MKRCVKRNLGKESAFRKMVRLIENIEYVSMSAADEMINWDIVKKIQL
jgi:hypothetical protein